MVKLTIIVTVYNEKDTIIRAIEEAKAISLDKEVIVVDNCSTDGTKELLMNLEDPSIKIVYQPKNYGYGMSVLTGMNLAKGEFLFVHNSDLEYDTECVYRMLKLAEDEKLDAIFGSRLLSRTSESRIKVLKERPFYLGTMIIAGLINNFYNKNFTDVIGNRFYRTAALRKINPTEKGISFDFEVVSKLCKCQFKILEVLIKYSPRVEGKKIKIYDIVPALLTILRIKVFG